MNELQKNAKRNLIQTLECLASKTLQTSYKKSVPFVHIPYELICQWDSHFYKDKKWFIEIWTSQEWKALLAFDQTFNRITELIPDRDFPDIPEVLTHPVWLEMIAAAEISTQSILTAE